MMQVQSHPNKQEQSPSMNTSTIAKLIAGAWQAEAKTVVLPDGSVVAVPEKPEGMRDEWIEPLMAVALFVLDGCDRVFSLRVRSHQQPAINPTNGSETSQCQVN